MALHVRCSSPHDSDFKQWGQRSHCRGRPWNLSWTSSLGQAFTNQQSDVMAAVQLMRSRAQAASTLQSSPQIKVVNPQTIVIEPANSTALTKANSQDCHNPERISNPLFCGRELYGNIDDQAFSTTYKE